MTQINFSWFKLYINETMQCTAISVLLFCSTLYVWDSSTFLHIAVFILIFKECSFVWWQMKTKLVLDEETLYPKRLLQLGWLSDLRNLQVSQNQTKRLLFIYVEWEELAGILWEKQAQVGRSNWQYQGASARNIFLCHWLTFGMSC